MNENQNQFDQNNSQWTETQRKQTVMDSAERKASNQKGSKILKYPYLVQRSSQKMKEDNNSNKSTQKHINRNPYRKKIFQTRSSILTNLKQSSFSADRNRINNINNFESNPIQFKIRNSKQKSSRMKLSYQSSNNAYGETSNVKKNGTNIYFHYSSPKSYGQPSVSVSNTGSSNIPRQKMKIYQPVISQPVNYPHIIQKPIQKSVTLIKNVVPPLNLANNVLPPSFSPSQTAQSKLQHPTSVTPINSNLNTIYEFPYKSSLPPSAFPQQNLPAYISQSIRHSVNPHPHPHTHTINLPLHENNMNLNSKPISFRPINISVNESPTMQVKEIIHIPRSSEERKSMFREYPQVATQQTITPNMYQTYKISDKFLRNSKSIQNAYQNTSIKITTPHKVHYNHPHHPTHLQHSKQRSRGKPHENVESLHDAKHCKSENSDQQFDEFCEENKYSDRFFDMDFNDDRRANSNLQRNFPQDIPMIQKNSYQSQLSSSNKFQQANMRKFNDQKAKNQVLVKRGSITSIIFQKQKEKSNNKIQQSQKRLFKPFSFSQNQINANSSKNNLKNTVITGIQNTERKFENQGRFFGYVLIALGVFLVILQIAK